MQQKIPFTALAKFPGLYRSDIIAAAAFAGTQFAEVEPATDIAVINQRIFDILSEMPSIPEFHAVHPGKMPARYFLSWDSKEEKVLRLADYIFNALFEAVESDDDDEDLDDDVEPSEPDIEDSVSTTESIAAELTGSPKQIAWAKSIILGSIHEIAVSRISYKKAPKDSGWWINHRNDLLTALKNFNK